MVAGWLNHNQLQIVKGIGKLPGDSNSAESDPVIVNLLGGVITLEQDGWTPEIAQVKNGGVWVDSPLSDGRELLAAAAGNVIEKMSVLITDGSYLGTIKALSGLNQMANDCRDYWQSEYQIEPVYLAWWAGCGAGPQYALLSNIEVSPDYLDSPTPTIRASITLEREPYWRGIPPGANPKYWTYYVNPAHPQFNYNVASLVSGTDHLIKQIMTNKFEWTPAAYGLQATPLNVVGQLSQNYIDISASQVPGDAPALVEMGITTDVGVPANIYVGRTSKKLNGTGHDGIARVNSLILNAGDGNTVGVVTKTAAGAANGVVSDGLGSPNYRYGVRTVTGADANYVTASQWGSNAGANGIKLDRELFRGTFAVFCRCTNQSAVAPVSTDMQIRLFVEEYEDNAANQSINSITLPAVYPQISNPALQYPNLSYMGALTLPLSNRSVQSPLGYGIQLQEANSNLRISVQLQVLVATANRTFAITDLIFIPIDEGMAQVNISLSTFSANGALIIDNTGYLTRGESKQAAVSYVTNANSGGVSQEIRGQDITLAPKTNQRLYFIGDVYNSTSTPTVPAYMSTPSQLVTVYLNIVPRWAAIRDV